MTDIRDYTGVRKDRKNHNIRGRREMQGRMTEKNNVPGQKEESDKKCQARVVQQ